MIDAGLILEGGGMRGVYTAGVLDYFIKRDLYFKDCFGVSAGACHGCSYMSKQYKRGYRVNVDYLKDKRYCSLYSLVTTGNLFGAEMLYEIIPNELDPFDYDVFHKNEGKFYAVVTNCRTGKAEYIQVKNMPEDIIAVRASSSMPLVSKNVKIGREEYLDGGIADSIPLKKSIQMGNQKNVIILTQCDGFQKTRNKAMPMMQLKYSKYPKLVNMIDTRHLRYNKALELVEEEKRAGRAFVIQPSKPVDISRIEKDKRKLAALYRSGYMDAKRLYPELKEFLNA